MFSHVVVGANDLDASRRFYDATLGALGIPPGGPDGEARIFYTTGRGVLGITRPINGNAATPGNGTTIGLTARSQDEVNAWHAAGVANGGALCEEPPGVRIGASGALYLAYLRDPAGNKLCCLHRLPPQDAAWSAGLIQDHAHGQAGHRTT